MIVGFYLLLVALTPVNFAWLWLLIGFVMQVIQFFVYVQRDYSYKSGNKNYWEGDQ